MGIRNRLEEMGKKIGVGKRAEFAGDVDQYEKDNGVSHEEAEKIFFSIEYLN